MHFNMAVVFYCIFSTIQPNLVTIGPIVMKKQPIFKIQDGGSRIFGFGKCIFSITIAFYVGLSSFPPNLVRIGVIVKKWQPIFEIQYGGRCHLEFLKICTFDAIRNTLDYTTAQTIATSLIHSKLDYCNSLFLTFPSLN